MQVHFWGVRGSIATSGPRFSDVGGNTTCIEVRHGDHRLVLDAGTGVKGLGDQLLAEAGASGRPVQATLLFTHLHWDHIQGFPFFAPGFVPGTSLELLGPIEESGATLEDALRGQMTAPCFPVPLEAMAADKTFGPIGDGARVDIGPFTVTARRLDHPQGVLGFRIEAEGRAVVFATDTEQALDQPIDPALLALAEGADLLIHDAQYTEAQYAGEDGPCRKGWGHSTYRAACRVAEAAGAGRLALFHHDPGHDDEAVAAIEADAQRYFAPTFAAREGRTVDVRPRSA